MIERSPRAASWVRSRSGLVLLGFLAIAGFFLVTEHRAHVFGALPYVLLLLCPLLHLLHGRHEGEHGNHGEGGSERRAGGAR